VRWRSPSEIAFRLRQEARNLALLKRPPKLPESANPRAPFPAPDSVVEALRGTAISEAIIGYADQIVLHRFPLLGIEVDTGPQIRWRRDYLNDKETGVEYFRRIPYLDASVAGDHKIIWELNRHQHLVLLAQAFRFTNRPEYLEEIEAQLDSWFEANPVQRGINWASALEVAFRALSWMWVDHLAGKDLDPARRKRLMEALYWHGFHLEANLSVYFSPNTHLLGEAVALHALGLMFRGIGPAGTWQREGAKIVAEEMQRQVRADGSHFEQSSYYHVYALDMFLFHATLAEPDEGYRRGLEKMAVYLEALVGPARLLPFIGDDDGGRFFHPYGRRDHFARATLAACGQFLKRPDWIGGEEELYETAAWWLGTGSYPNRIDKPSSSARFADSGTVVMSDRAAHCIIDAGPFGPFRGGHSHADTLSIVAGVNGQDLLIDPGTYSYSGDSPWRNRFRGTAAHNTVRIGGLDQAEPGGPFGWQTPPEVEVLEWRSDPVADYLDAECRYRGFRHRRRIFFRKPDLLFIVDDIEGGRIDAEQFWHPGGSVEPGPEGCFRIGAAGMLMLCGGTPELSRGEEFGWRSPAYGEKEAAPLIVSRLKGEESVRFAAALSFSAPVGGGRLVARNSGDEVKLSVSGPWNLVVTFPKEGVPSCGDD
jgi:hypothetical protein